MNVINSAFQPSNKKIKTLTSAVLYLTHITGASY